MPYSDATTSAALKYSAVVLGGIAIVSLAIIGFRMVDWSSTVEGEGEFEVAVEQSTIVTPEFSFTNVASASGIDFKHYNGAYGERLLPETMGGGVAFFDYDNDGLEDLLLVDSAPWTWHDYGDEHTSSGSRLYRNVGDGLFERVPVPALENPLYGMGVAIGDYDADGYRDVYLTAVGANRLLRNAGDGTFLDLTKAMEVEGGENSWSTCATFFDFDSDGDLDLFVCNYVEWSPDIDRAVDFRLTGVGRAYGPPTDFGGTANVLYRNDGDRFTDVSFEAGIVVLNRNSGLPEGKALAAVPVDVNQDALVDLIVANDTVRNFLFVNRGNGSFAERGVEFGLAFDASGMATGAMGIDVANFRNDGDLGVVIGNFANEMSSFYVRRGTESMFSDDAVVVGIGAETRRALTFGVVFADFDLDGREDIFSANGHVEPEIQRVQSSQTYAQQPQLFWNCGVTCDRIYVAVQSGASEFWDAKVARGVATADFDNDGDIDLAVTEVGGAFALLRNDTNLSHNWLKISLRYGGGNRFGLGSTVRLRSGGTEQTRYLSPSRSYLAQLALPVVFGLGPEVTAEVSVIWPDGTVTQHAGLQANRLHIVRHEHM